MDLTNQTGIPAELRVTSLGGRRRAGVLTVKATFEVVGGRLELDTENPAPILSDDEDAELGLLPNDLHVPGDIPDFEIIVLGAACSVRPVEQWMRAMSPISKRRSGRDHTRPPCHDHPTTMPRSRGSVRPPTRRRRRTSPA